MAIKWPDLLRPFRRSQPPQPAQEVRPTLHPLTNEVYETTHVGVIDITEASKRSSRAKGPQNLSMAWDDDALGIPGYRTRDGGLLSERDRKDTYYQAYINNPWVRACVQAIAKRFTSGKWELEEVEKGGGSQQNYDKLYNLLIFINEDEDFKQLLRAIAEDLLIYGEAFVEMVFGPGGIPVQLHKIDCITMSVQFDKHGMVARYTQTLDKSTDTVDFDPKQLIRWWFPDPRASKKALSPIECIKDSVYLYTSMITWGEKFFKQGGKPVFSIEMGEDSNLDDANRYIKFFKENYMGLQNAHVPPVFYGGSRLVEFGKGSVELDFLQSLAWNRDEILSGYNTPLNVLGIQETAHLGGGSGESSNKIFVYNTVKPIEELILEKLNYRLVRKGFGIGDWMITVSHADYRDDQEITKVQDMQIRNGSLTINEARAERARMPIKGGDEAVIVAGKDILPVERNAEIADEQRQQAQLSLQGAKTAIIARQQNTNQGSNSDQQATSSQQEPEEDGEEEEPQRDQKKQERLHGSSTQAHKTSLSNAYETSREPPYEAYADETSYEHEPPSRSGASQQGWQAYHTPSGQSTSAYQAPSRQASFTQSEAARQAASSVAQAKSAPQGPSPRQETPFKAQEAFFSQAPYQAAYEETQPREEACEALSSETQTSLYTQETYHSSYASQDSQPSYETQENSLVSHWQDADKDTLNALADFKAKGVKRITWKAHMSACEECAQNDGKTVNLGERFPSGAYIVPNHNHCACAWIDTDTGQRYEWQNAKYVQVSKEDNA